MQAALGLLSREGLPGMSLRKVAAELETGAASLYAYVESLEELQALVCDRGLSGVKTRSSKATWREQLSDLLSSYLRVLMATPGLAQLAMKTVAIGPNALRILEAQLALLEQGGVERGAAAWASDLLTLHVTAIASEQSERKQQADPLGPAARVIGAVEEARFPHIFAAREELLSGGPARLAWVLEVLIEGVLRAPRPAPTDVTRTARKIRKEK